MYLFRRLALLLAICLAAGNVLFAQNSGTYSVANLSVANPFAEFVSSSSEGPEVAEDQAQPQAPQAGAPTPSTGQNQGPVTVQGRVRARREQRRAQAIRDTYSHLYEAYVGMGYLRFQPGKNLQHVTYYSWDAEFTRFYSERLGVTLGGRGYYGTPFIPFSPPSNGSTTRPAVSTYAVIGGPVYRFYLQPKYAISGRVTGGWALGHFSGDTNGFGSERLGMWPDGSTYALNGSLIGDWNLSPGFGLRLAGEYFGTGFGGQVQNSFGFTGGFVYRFGRQ